MRKNGLAVLILLASCFLFHGVVFAGLNDGLVAYWPFNGNAHDESGNGHDGTAYGATLTQDRFGNANQAYNFDGVNDYIDIGTGVKPVFPCTVSAWFKTANDSVRQDLFGNDMWSSTGCCYNGIVVTPAPSYVYCSYGDGGPNVPSSRRGIYAVIDPLLDSAQWHHLACVYNAHLNVDIYVDGVKMATQWNNGTGDTIQYSSTPGKIGSGYDNFPFNGSIDDIRVYNRALSESEIHELYVGDFNLKIVKSGAGSGTVTSDPSGINCGAVCSAAFVKSGAVTLTATPGINSIFTGWSGGGCSGTGACTVTMSNDITVTSTFVPSIYTVTASVSTGHGRVSPDSQKVSYKSSASITIAPDTGYHIDSITDNGQSVAIANPYVISDVTADHTVMVTFSTSRLTIQKGGNGSGAVASSPSGIDCGTTCTATYKKGTRVTLTPTPAPGSVFKGWTGACKGKGACAVVMSADKTVGATFDTGSCAYVLSPANKTVSYKGGTITIGVRSKDFTYCLTPDIVNNTDFTYTAFAFTKDKGSIKLFVPASDSSVDKHGTMIIGGSTFTVTRKGEPCTLMLSSSSSPLIPKAGGDGHFDVTVAPTNCEWTATADAKSAWIHATTGNGGVDYAVDNNGGSSTRSGKIEVTLTLSKKSKSYTVKQGKE